LAVPGTFAIARILTVLPPGVAPVLRLVEHLHQLVEGVVVLPHRVLVIAIKKYNGIQALQAVAARSPANYVAGP
jgi:hypothetical protein